METQLPGSAQRQALWKVEGLERFHGECHEQFGLAESPLMVDDKLIFTQEARRRAWWPWMALQPDVVAEPKCGRDLLLASHPSTSGRGPRRDRDRHGPGPARGERGHRRNRVDTSRSQLDYHTDLRMGRLYDGNNVLAVTASPGDASVVWTQAAWASFGHFVRLGNRLYGTVYEQDRPRGFACTDWQTGKTLSEDRTIKEASVTSADGLLYAYEHNGAGSCWSGLARQAWRSQAPSGSPKARALTTHILSYPTAGCTSDTATT